MNTVFELIGYLNDALFAGLAIVAYWRWRGRRDEATKWFALTFGVLSVVVLASLLVPQDAEGTAANIFLKLEIAILVLFPYLLYRFAESFSAGPRWMRIAAAVLTVAVMVGTFALPPLATIENDRPPLVQLWIFGLLLQWSLLSLTVTGRLWLAGRGQPSVARRRMRLLSLGAFGMTVAVIIAGTAPAGGEEARPIDLVTQLLSFVSAVSFFLGFAPPSFLRTIWRGPESDSLRAAISGLMGSRSEREVAHRLLPHVVSIIGARGAAIVKAPGRVIASEGVSEGMMQEITQASPDTLREEMHTPRLVILPFEFGSMIVWGSAYTPFFGREEVDLVRSLGSLTDVAFERAELFDREQEARKDAEDSKEQLEGANEDLAQKEAQLAEAQEISHIGSWEWDSVNDKMSWSDELFRILGLEPQPSQATLEAFLEYVHPEDKPLFDSALTRSAESVEGLASEVRIVRSSGETRTLQVTARVVPDGTGRAARMIGIAQDITERKETERALADAFSRERLARVSAERAGNELEQFVYSVSHDLNNPLVAILGYLDYLEKDHGPQLAEAGRFYIERMTASAQFMRSLIKDLLELSRVGRSQTEPEDVDLGSVVGEIVDDVKATNPQVDFELGTLPGVRMNPVRARQLFANLIQNSVKYSERPDVRVSVNAAEQDSNGFVCVSVADNGPGIPEEKRELVFGVFERLDSAKEGSGIGLAVCKRIVDTVGGRIWIADAPEGTEVRVLVPPATDWSEE